jgi:hypothetical protein
MACLSPIMILYEEPDENHLCLVIYFLALALPDGASKYYSSIADLEGVRSIHDQKVVTFLIDPEMTEKPLLIVMEKDGTLSPSRVLSYACMNNMLKGTGEWAGHGQMLSEYCLRRGLGVVIDSNLKWFCIISTTDRRQRDPTPRYHFKFKTNAPHMFDHI